MGGCFFWCVDFPAGISITNVRAGQGDVIRVHCLQLSLSVCACACMRTGVYFESLLILKSIIVLLIELKWRVSVPDIISIVLRKRDMTVIQPELYFKTRTGRVTTRCAMLRSINTICFALPKECNTV